MRVDEISVEEWLFIGEYMKDGKPREAILRSGYVGKFAMQEACRILNKKAVKAELEKMVESIKIQIQLTTKMVTQDIVNVLAADPRDLYEVKIHSCRHCHGLDFGYQRTLGEYNIAKFKADAEGKYFDPMGGIGYNPHQDPDPDCTECFGRGVLVEEIKDMRTLSPEALSLYMGGKRGKHGLEINMRSKDAARESAARILGLNKETLNVKTTKAEDMGDDDLAAIARGEK